MSTTELHVRVGFLQEFPFSPSSPSRFILSKHEGAACGSMRAMVLCLCCYVQQQQQGILFLNYDVDYILVLVGMFMHVQKRWKNNCNVFKIASENWQVIRAGRFFCYNVWSENSLSYQVRSSTDKLSSKLTEVITHSAVWRFSQRSRHQNQICTAADDLTQQRWLVLFMDRVVSYWSLIIKIKCYSQETLGIGVNINMWTAKWYWSSQMK